ncbi:tetratricopeptide repeat protein [Candidatus Sumerlaeota bacterium]|nr:tetratricopeptide repeat protein [Candidatus Sumerlaeota bacterium]
MMAPRGNDEEDDSWTDNSDEIDDEEDDGEDEEEGAEIEALIAQSEEMAERGEQRKALRLWRKNIDRFADEPVAFYQMALAIFRLIEEASATEEMWEADADLVGMYEEAIGILEEALTMDDEHVDSWNLLGALLELRENHEEAIVAWERSLELNPDQKVVREDLKRVKKIVEEE